MSATAHRFAILSIAVLTLTAGTTRSQPAPRGDEAKLEFFEKKIRPLLANNCYNCHSANTNSQGGLRVDDRNGLLQGGKSGAAVVPGQPGKSLMLLRVRHADDSKRMPPKKQLDEAQLADLAKWIKDGAAWPSVQLPASFGKVNPRYERLRKEHWAWQPLRSPSVPAVADAAWPRDDIDRFLLAGLTAKGLAPVADADRVSLLRRVTFDLTGLPPTLADIDAFVKDDASDAFARVVDRLLQAPAFGERWGRHWLDIARYGESTGPSRNIPYPHAWRYRDYVLDALNKDVPYDRFLREQLAGDLLPAASSAERDRQLIATGFLVVGTHDVNQRFKVRFDMDNIDEQIDTVGRAVLGLTLGCARCHDHKFDPIPTKDYYALAGIFQSTDMCAGVRNKMGGGGLDYFMPAMLLKLSPTGQVAAPPPEKVAQLTRAVAKAKEDFEKLRDSPEGNVKGPNGQPRKVAARQKWTKLQNELTTLTDPAAQGPFALGVRDAKTVSDTGIRVRGIAEQIGPVVPRGFLSLLEVPDAPKINPAQSGRLELAQWLTSPRNPLTPRVMVNRVWKHLFGQGLVTSVDNFGVTGDVPSHPELLDHLALRFIKDGWSVKRLVRAMVLSRAYQLGSSATPAHLTADPANRLLWRHSPRRLAAEEIRDAALAAAGTLLLTPPGASPAKDLPMIELADNSPPARKLVEAAENSLHRSVYLPLLRGITPRALEVFDFADQGLVTGSRDTTTVAPQALYFLNDPFVKRQASTLAARLLERTELDGAGRVQLAYRLTLSREPTARECERVLAYLTEYDPAAPRSEAWASFCQALFGSAEFRYLK